MALKRRIFFSSVFRCLLPRIGQSLECRMLRDVTQGEEREGVVREGGFASAVPTDLVADGKEASVSLYSGAGRETRKQKKKTGSGALPLDRIGRCRSGAPRRASDGKATRLLDLPFFF